jgi:hypothetical protein
MRSRLFSGILRQKRIRRLALFTTLGCGTLALLAPVASAFSASIAFNGCASVAFNYKDFTAGSPVTATETLSVNGTQVASQPFAFTPAAPNLTETDSIPIADRHNGDTLVASTTYSVPSQGVFNAVVTSPPYTLAGCTPPPPPPATTTIATTAQAPTAANGLVDTAVLSGGNSPTGTITFNLFGPGDTACAKSLSTSTATVNGNASYASAAFTATVAGTYEWTASYSGDANNAASSEGCGQTAEMVTVPQIVIPPAAKFATTITTVASSASGCKGSTSKTCKISDKAKLAGGDPQAAPTGTITFKLYARSDSTCSTPLSTATVTVSHGLGIYASPTLTESKSRGYQWTASYGGDANNSASTETAACATAAEQIPAMCVAVKVSLSGPFGNSIPGLFTARVTARGVKSVTFYLGKKKISTSTKAHGGAFSVTIDTTHFKVGIYTVTAKATMTNKLCASVTRSGTFVHRVPGVPVS